ncbi:hypothetical protein BU26DRAFT_558541 [Trematosphaeria pertusa]|uniref:Uncharacterized protein n=1 Tax=Trematosphaeria pertusa TaxID=390896 RepID=A0A6A6J343_9PLEO|nr:uncharacterized protein BU26DRAFT_558541 [Trematosphaeria pertusa]KAF2257129.1 hypothetical protein BU26DRAFT_558541 [Trematosphaeria pertusa]
MAVRPHELQRQSEELLRQMGVLLAPSPCICHWRAIDTTPLSFSSPIDRAMSNGPPYPTFPPASAVREAALLSSQRAAGSSTRRGHVPAARAKPAGGDDSVLAPWGFRVLGVEPSRLQQTISINEAPAAAILGVPAWDRACAAHSG